MRKVHAVESWVVFEMTINGKTTGRRALCEQEEWDAMQLANPTQHTLIQSGITNEGEAERLARGTSGDPKRKPTISLRIDAAEPVPIPPAL